MTTLYLIRHGQTEWNVQRRFQGQQNSPLTPLGIQQALDARDRVARLRPQVLYTSDAQRAQHTARLLFPDLEPIACPMLREISLGILEGMIIEDAKSQYPDSACFFERPEDFCPAEGGESVPQVMDRAQAFLDLLLERHAGRRVAAISHGGTIKALHTVVENRGSATLWQGPHVSNLSTLRFLHDGSFWRYAPQEET